MDCIFCKIVAGEIPAEKIFENEHTFAFLDIQPVNFGHTLVVPKKHFRNVFDIPPAVWSQILTTAHYLAPRVRDAVNAEGVNISSSNEPAAGQTVFHAHTHIIPRFSDDGQKSWITKQYADGESSKIADNIRTQLET